jgi:microcystin-dependent protein
LGCITGVTVDAGTHDVLQAVITELCVAIGDIVEINNLLALCITQSNINSYIQLYLDSISTANKMYTKMVPYVIYPFYPSAAIMVGAFDSNGVGISTGIWEKVYFCNGWDGRTPDLRGYSLIGVTNGMLGGTFDERVDPLIAGNHSYELGDPGGNNSITLSAAQMAAHNHATTVVFNDPGHYTNIKAALSGMTEWDDDSTNTGCPINRIESLSGPNGNGAEQLVSTTTLDETGITVGVSNSPNVGGEAHDNVHPVMAVYYIMYCP